MVQPLKHQQHDGSLPTPPEPQTARRFHDHLEHVLACCSLQLVSSPPRQQMIDYHPGRGCITIQVRCTRRNPPWRVKQEVVVVSPNVAMYPMYSCIVIWTASKSPVKQVGVYTSSSLFGTISKLTVKRIAVYGHFNRVLDKRLGTLTHIPGHILTRPRVCQCWKTKEQCYVCCIWWNLLWDKLKGTVRMQLEHTGYPGFSFFQRRLKKFFNTANGRRSPQSSLRLEQHRRQSRSK